MPGCLCSSSDQQSEAEKANSLLESRGDSQMFTVLKTPLFFVLVFFCFVFFKDNVIDCM